MMRAHVDVRTVFRVVYDWICPGCNQRNSMTAADGDFVCQTIQCAECGLILYRHGPGEFGSERPR